MATTIQVTAQVKTELDAIKEYPRQTYNEVIATLVKMREAISEDKELRDDLLAEMAEARREIAAGKGLTTAQLLKSLGVKA